jgi:YbgC/YbaW family acyl-CoA thioester hydrolase
MREARFMEFHYERLVSPNELQHPHHHVHHSDSLRFLEEARLAFLRHRGIDYEALLQARLFLVITDITVRYKREIRGEPIRISCENPLIDGKRIQLEQKIYRLNHKVAVEAIIGLMFLDANQGRSVAAPGDFAGRFCAGIPR